MDEDIEDNKPQKKRYDDSDEDNKGSASLVERSEADQKKLIDDSKDKPQSEASKSESEKGKNMLNCAKGMFEKKKKAKPKVIPISDLDKSPSQCTSTDYTTKKR